MINHVKMWIYSHACSINAQSSVSSCFLNQPLACSQVAVVYQCSLTLIFVRKAWTTRCRVQLESGPGKLMQRIVQESGFFKVKIFDFLVQRVTFWGQKLATIVLKVAFFGEILDFFCKLVLFDLTIRIFRQPRTSMNPEPLGQYAVCLFG
jgi:hypothetical protein